jgi:hypothetical protein
MQMRTTAGVWLLLLLLDMLIKCVVSVKLTGDRLWACGSRRQSFITAEHPKYRVSSKRRKKK